MAESSGEKTEAPTPRRRTEARQQGNIARSPDLNSALLLLGAMLLLRWFGQPLIATLHGVVAEMLSAGSLSDISLHRLPDIALNAVAKIGIAIAPFLGGAMLVVILASIAQVGFVLNPQRLAPNLAALSPVRGLGKIFGRGQGAVHLLMNLAKVVLVGLVAYSAVAGRIGQIIAIQQLAFVQSFAFGCQLIYTIGMRVGVLLLVLAILDYFYQRYRLEQSLKMTKEEVKDEMRSMEGDPKVKQRRRQVQVQRHMQRLKKEVPRADVVVTNPTHVAVALKYEEGKMRAPKLLAKGLDFMALRIRELAVEAGVPIVERPPLARAIYRMVDVGEEIPEEFYSAVAEILAYVYELNRKARGIAVPA